MQNLKDKVVFITGASAGIGKATAEAFAREGARLVLAARRFDRLIELEKSLKESYRAEIFSLELDVSNSEEVEKKLHALPTPFAIPDILINNAGLVRGLNKIWESSPEEWNEVIDTNVKGILNVCRALVPQMVERDSGHIINIGSIAGHQSYPGGGVYCATKHAVTALTDVLRQELVATPLRVSLVSPGMVHTEFSLVRYKGDKERAEKVYKGIDPLLPEDIAETILFIASRPPHVNIADVILYPTHQASVALLHRNP